MRQKPLNYSFIPTTAPCKNLPTKENILSTNNDPEMSRDNFEAEHSLERVVTYCRDVTLTFCSLI